MWIQQDFGYIKMHKNIQNVTLSRKEFETFLFDAYNKGNTKK